MCSLLSESSAALNCFKCQKARVTIPSDESLQESLSELLCGDIFWNGPVFGYRLFKSEF